MANPCDYGMCDQDRCKEEDCTSTPVIGKELADLLEGLASGEDTDYKVQH